MRDVVAAIRTNEDGTLIPWDRLESCWHSYPVTSFVPPRNVPVELRNAAKVLRDRNTFRHRHFTPDEQAA